MDNYTLDKCIICGKYKALKNNVCIDCTKNIPLPDFLEDLFKSKEKNE